MKRFLYAVVVFSMVVFMGCATSKTVTSIGDKVGKSFQESAALGEISAEQAIKSWGYVRGQIEGTLATSYEIEITPTLEVIIEGLDELYIKEELTARDKGKIMGYFCRLEIEAAKIGWDRYGVSITKFIFR